MKILGNLSLVAATTTALLAIWTQHHWQFGLTAVIFFFAGAALHRNNRKENTK